MTGAASPNGELILYASPDGRQVVQLRASGGTVWLTQMQIAELFGTSIPNVAQLISRVLGDGEVTEATINSELMVRTEGTRQVTREVKVYNLDMILAVGYRVSTPRAVQFRQWATTVLKEFLIKGFAMNDAYLKDPAGVDYFDELLERIRSIRASEKRFYQKVRDIFAETSSDYDSKSELARSFFATIQNKLLFAVTGKTAAELVVARSDASAPNLGLTTWAGKEVKRLDAETAKNYLTHEEIRELDRLTVMFLDFAEDRSARRQEIRMADWVTQADRFLDFNERTLLGNAGSVSHQSMKAEIGRRYDDFDNNRKATQARQALEEEAKDLTELMNAAEAITRPDDNPEPGRRTDGM
ncbi:virulence RhuM family protein [Pseudarthrobacter sp. Y6]|uniref:virulence RhuM family protein n=1 Tax=Pseudarthrobacter sp. Y6 TaxID=3418422 RepID=UPI003CEC793D